MTKTMIPTHKDDDILADFTDHVLDKSDPFTQTHESDEKLRGLEETVLRLNRVFPPLVWDEKTSRKMRVDFKIRLSKIENTHRPVFPWFQPARKRLVMVLGAAALITAAIFLALPDFVSGAGGMQGSAGLNSQNIILLIFLAGGIVLLAVWLGQKNK